MGSSSNELNLSTGKEVEDTDSTVEIKIKTMDSQTHTVRVHKCVPIPALKEQIATVTGVLSEQQRLIYRGKVLRDDALLSAHHVEDGHTLHLVVRQPNQASPLPSISVGSEGATASDFRFSEHNIGSPSTHAVVFDVVNIGQANNTSQGISQFISSILTPILSSMDNTRNHLRESNLEGNARTSTNRDHQDAIHAQQSAAAPGLGLSPQHTAHFREVIPDSLTIMNEYMDYLQDHLQRHGLIAVVGEPNNNSESSGMHGNEGQRNNRRSLSVTGQGNLSSLASLAEILRATRNILIEQAGGCLSRLARLLEDQMSVTDPSIRMQIQSIAQRIGAFLQRLGPLLLELGRSTMALQMGQTPSQAVVNTGPAVFVSAFGPTSLMVQVDPANSNSGRIHTGYGLEGGQSLGSSYSPRNFVLHAGSAVPGASGESREQDSAQQGQEQMNGARNSSITNSFPLVIAGLSGNASSGESAVHIVPLRTLVSVSAGVFHSASDPSGSGIGILYPLQGRAQDLNSGGMNDPGGSQASTSVNPGNPEIGQLRTFNLTNQRQNLESTNAAGDANRFHTNTAPATSGVDTSVNRTSQNQGFTRIAVSGQQGLSNNDNSSTQTHTRQQDVQFSLEDMFDRFGELIRDIMGEEIGIGGFAHHDSAVGSASDQADSRSDTEMQDASEALSHETLFFSNLLRQVMPYISQSLSSQPNVSPIGSSSTSQTERENRTDSSSRNSQDRRDLAADTYSKRQRRE